MQDTPITKSPDYARYNAIYSDGPDRYDRLVACEDADRNILPGLKSVAKIEDATIVELGCGTGRLTRLVAPEAKKIYAFDIEPAMVNVARSHLLGVSHVSLGVADHQHLPIGDRVADTVFAGWTINHHIRQATNWELEIEKTISEMSRVVKLGGMLVILETLGVARIEPAPPSPRLERYYSVLEQLLGFSRKVIKTDYVFASHAEALDLVGFFFGDEVSSYVANTRLVRLPEFTGIWSKLIK